jgi:hypothetical protein
MLYELLICAYVVVSWYSETSVSVIVAYAILLARSVATRPPEALSRPKVRLEAWSTMTSPAAGKPVSRQWPLDMTIAGSLSSESGKRTTEPEQLLSETVPAKLTAWTVGAVILDTAAVVDVTASLTTDVVVSVSTASTVTGLGAATAGAAPAPAITRARSAAPRGFLMWGSPH